MVEPPGTNTSIDINGVNINVFPTSINYTIGDTVKLEPQIDPLWGFSYWETDSVVMMPLPTNPTDSFYVNHHDTVVLHIYELPTIEALLLVEMIVFAKIVRKMLKLVFHLVGFLHLHLCIHTMERIKVHLQLH